MNSLRSGAFRTAVFSGIAVLMWRGTSLAQEARRAREEVELDRQTREFKVSVDGTPRGKCTMRISRFEDGTERVKIDSQIRVNYVVSAYRFSSSGTELWRDGQLTELENSVDYNGVRYLVKAGATRKGLQVTVNGRPSPNDVDAWVTSYWHIPERLLAEPPVEQAAAPRGGRRPAPKGDAVTVPLLDSNRGRALRGKLQRVADETVRVGGRRTNCTHFRVAGDVQVDLWYDADRRLVRQESVDEGHDTVLELVKIVDEP